MMKHEEKKNVPSENIFEGPTAIFTFYAEKSSRVMHKKLLQHGNI
jgi:hypothetical protein